MPEPVAEKGLPVRGARLTFRALRRALPRVGSHMSQQIPLQVEAPPTVMAAEAPRTLRDAPLLLCLSLFAEFLPGPPWLVLQVAPLVLL